MQHEINPSNESKFRLEITHNGQPVDLIDVVTAVAAGKDPATYQGRWEPVTTAAKEPKDGPASGPLSQIRDAFSASDRGMQ